MKTSIQILTISLLAGTLFACSSDENDSTTGSIPVDSGTPPGTSTPPDSGTPPDTGTPPDDLPTTGNNPYVPPLTGLPAPTIPQLDPLASPVPGPSLDDPFGSQLETDEEASVAGGAPTIPKNLRIDLVSNNWSEFSWAPSNDDNEVVAYNIYRSDGHVYVVARDETDAVQGTQSEIDKFWNTTSFIDCNYTRFIDRIHECGVNGPKPGDIFSYQVSAVDDDGQESGMSNSITINYHKDTGAAVPVYDDPYLADGFVQQNDLTNTAYFLDEFDLVFEDDFDGTSIDENKWNTQLTWGDTKIINGEQQYFVNTQRDANFGYNPFNIQDSTLTIEAIATPPAQTNNLPPICDEPDPLGYDRCSFLSGALSSHDKFGMTYGFMEGRMKVSGAAGALSSFYLYHRYPGTGANRHAPEIDVVEYLGENPYGTEDAFQTYHFADVNTGEIRSAPTMNYKNPTGELYADDYHTYAVLWEPQLVIWYIDGKEIKRLSGVQVSRQQMNIVTYLVAGSGWAPTPDVNADIFPLQYEIDYIRAYQRPAYNGNGLYPEM
ncbi:MAG: family 16 glycosylhydrolase [Granulosicoccus sp.]